MERQPVVVGLLGYGAVCAWTAALFGERNPEVLALLHATAMGGTLLVCGLSLFVCGAGLAWALGQGRAAGTVPRWLCVLTVGVFVLFSHESFHYWLYRLASVRTLTGGVLYGATAALVLWLAWRASRLEAARFAVATFGVLLLGLVTSALFFAPRSDASTVQPDKGTAVHDGAAPGLSGENVYYVILDGYGGARTLKDLHGIDIGPFIDDMAQQGLTHLPSARSNYIVTHASLAGTLEMDYSFDENTPRYGSREAFFPQLLSRTRPPEAVRRVRAGGYRFVHIGNTWGPCRWRETVECVVGDGLHAGQVAETVERYLRPTQLAASLRLARARLHLDPGARRADDALEMLSRAIQGGLPADRPTFFFVHHLVPHDPLNADCSRSDREMALPLYINAVRCVNREAVKLAALIRSRDPRALVVFQADHGSEFLVDWKLPLASWSPASIDERTSILNLVHVPPACQGWLREDLSPINTMRLVTACLQRRPPAYVEERSYLTTYETAPDFGRVLRVHR